MEGGIEVMGRQGKIESNYWITLGENEDTGNWNSCTVWRTRFGRGYGLVKRQSVEWNIY